MQHHIRALALAALSAVVSLALSAAEPTATWMTTTQTASWQANPPATVVPIAAGDAWDVEVHLDRPQQTIDGFGTCFNALGWTSLSALGEAEREGVLRELFAPGVGANFTICRMPVGANDFSLDWYSYDEVADDFALEHFTIDADRSTLIPFIKHALVQQPALKLWASPWSPPTWMKTNGHYSAREAAAGLPSPGNAEGTDQFIQENRYFIAYARYFARFIEAYAQEGISISMVMPQNEFNSAQPFPSCCWTVAGLTRFIAFLGPEMRKRGVEVFFGTWERGDDERLKALDAALSDSSAGPFISGAGFQWAGKDAIPKVHRRHPELKLYQTEQECGDGKNDWSYCRYTWTLMRQYLEHGASAYCYWNTSLAKGGMSRWGWAQNSLVTVDTEAKTFAYNHDYFVLKHVSHFVLPGARRLERTGKAGYDNLLAFANPDGGVVVVMQNGTDQHLPVRVKLGDRVLSAELEADSFNTFVVR